MNCGDVTLSGTAGKVLVCQFSYVNICTQVTGGFLKLLQLRPIPPHTSLTQTVEANIQLRQSNKTVVSKSNPIPGTGQIHGGSNIPPGQYSNWLTATQTRIPRCNYWFAVVQIMLLDHYNTYMYYIWCQQYGSDSRIPPLVNIQYPHRLPPSRSTFYLNLFFPGPLFLT